MNKFWKRKIEIPTSTEPQVVQVILPCRCGYSINVPILVPTWLAREPQWRKKLDGPVNALLDHYDNCTEYVGAK